MRADKAPIIRVNLGKSDSELLQIANLLDINPSDILLDKTKFRVIYFMLDNDLQYRTFAYIRKNSKKMEYTLSLDKYLNSLPDTDIDSIKNITETFDRINNNTKYLLGEKVDLDSIKNETHLDKLSAKLPGQKKVDITKEKKVTFKKLNIDEVLDKIDQKGIDTLTKVERKFLEDYSKNL
jgi:hypothetical protein